MSELTYPYKKGLKTKEAAEKALPEVAQENSNFTKVKDFIITMSNSLPLTYQVVHIDSCGYHPNYNADTCPFNHRGL